MNVCIRKVIKNKHRPSKVNSCSRLGFTHFGWFFNCGNSHGKQIQMWKKQSAEESKGLMKSTRRGGQVNRRLECMLTLRASTRSPRLRLNLHRSANKKSTASCTSVHKQRHINKKEKTEGTTLMVVWKPRNSHKIESCMLKLPISPTWLQKQSKKL